MKTIFGKKEVPGSTQKEINNRGTKAGLLWTSKRFPWIKVTSLSSSPGKHGTLGLGSKLYEGNYIRPLPVVTQLQVKKQGELGTTRRATIDITAFSDEQLVELQKAFFIPAMGVRVEWGWNEDSSGTTAEPLTLDKSTSNPKAICKINDYAKTHSNYDGLQGIVGNFSYKLTTNNTWECSVEIISSTEGVAGSSVVTHNCDCPRSYKNEAQEDAKEQIESKSDLYTFFNDLYKNYDKVLSIYIGNFGSYPDAYHLFRKGKYKGPRRDERGGDDSAWYESLIGAVIKPETEEPYISFASLETAINTLCLPTSKEKIHTIGKIHSKNTLLAYHPSLESTDPRVCIIPGTKYADIVTFNDACPSAITTDESGKQRVFLKNVMVNVVFLMMELNSVEKGDVKLSTFIRNVLQKINEACGNLWEFEIVSSEGNCDGEEVPELTIIDTKVYTPGGPFSIPSLAIGNPASVIRDLTLSMKMTENMKTQALYAGSKTATKTPGGGNCAPKAFEPFTLGGTNTNLAAKKPDDKKDCPCTKAPIDKPPPKTFDDYMTALKEDVSSTTTSAARSALMELYNPTKGDNDNHCVGMIIPFEFSFTLDGIGGFSFGQMVTSDRIPSAVSKQYEWQVTTVEHTLTPNDWITTVNTVMRYKKK